MRPAASDLITGPVYTMWGYLDISVSRYDIDRCRYNVDMHR